MSTFCAWCAGEQMRAAELVTELKGWKEPANPTDDSRRQFWLMQKAAAKIEHLADMLDSYMALRDPTTPNP